MFFGTKNDNFKDLADEREKLLLQYSNLVRSIAKGYGHNELPDKGVIHPTKAEDVLRKILASKGANVTANAQANEPTFGEETRPLPSTVRCIDLTGPLNITVKKGNVCNLQIACSDKKYLSKVITDLQGDTVYIGLESMSFISKGDGHSVVQNFHGPIHGNLVGGNVQIVGTGNTVISRRKGATITIGEIHQPYESGQDQSLPVLDFSIVVTLPSVQDLQLSGSGSINYLDIETMEIGATTSGSGSITLKGKVEALRAKVSGSGGISAKGLNATRGVLEVTGSGDIKATVSHSVDAKVTGSGDIRIHGNPQSQKTKVTGSGDIDFA